MELKFQNPGFAYSLDSIMEFQRDGEAPYWSNSLYYFYPGLDRGHALTLPKEQRCAYIGGVLEQVYQEKLTLLSEKEEAYNHHWQKYKEQVNEAFSEAFQVDCENSYNDIVGNITLNPIGPRYLEKRTFDVFYLNSERGALGMALHEMVHFVWFDVWNRHFRDDAVEYERPHLKWILSEMAVESIMRDERLSSINPYFPRDYEKNQNGCVYDYFYTMKIEGKPILETLYEKYQSLPIIDYMEWGYEYCKRYEQQIRKYIEEYEAV